VSPTGARELRAQVQQAYNATGASWADGPIHIYRRLARALVERSPVPLAGRIMVDAGAGTGALSRALAAAGATPVAMDLAVQMLVAGRAEAAGADRSWPAFAAAAGDAGALPFRSSSVDGAGAAFSLSHVPSPLTALREMVRITRSGGIILLSSYGGPNAHIAKVAVDGAASALGFVAPAWHEVLKRETEPLVGSIDALTALAGEVGLTAVSIEREHVDVELADPDALVRWRMGMPHLAPFVASLSPARRDELVTRALDAIGPHPDPYRPDVLFFTATVR
jgi:ubiquinone/menaquinone biosynthesis C-methylase UbiE